MAPRIVCRAEPVTAAVAVAAATKAAGAAKAAAAAQGAAKTAGGVAGSAGVGTKVQSGQDAEKPFDEELSKRKFLPQDRGTPEYEAYMKQLRKQKEIDWKVKTGRNPDGNFGSANDEKLDWYDPLASAEPVWLDEAQAGGFYTGEFDPAFQVGVTAPLGFFDPLGFCKKGDKKTFTKLRAAELKHGRVAMMASVGAVVQHYVQFPGFTTLPKGLGAVNTAPGSYGAIALFALAGVLELTLWTESPDKEPGNFGDPAGWDIFTEDQRNRELNNGRFAMFATLGIIAAELLTGKDAIEQFGF